MNSTDSRRRRGMTLVEVLIVVVIISLVTAGVSVAAYGYLKEAKIKTAATEARKLHQAVVGARTLRGFDECPTLEQLLASELLDEDSSETDPWGKPWVIECQEHRVSITSSGPDGKLKSDDDIRVPERK